MKNVFKAIVLMLFVPMVCFGQVDDLSSDELFVMARDAAFEQKNYPKAIAISKIALEKSPNYTDISVFLGRLYTWSDKVDSAKMVFEGVRMRDVDNEDFYLAYVSLLYWNDYPREAIQIVNEGLIKNPYSEDLLLLKAKVYSSNKEYKEANEAINALLERNPKHTEGRSMALRIQEYSAKNGLGINYYFTHFDKQFANNWHIVSLNYKRVTPIGSVIFKTNYANKFADNGMQFELEAYPKINKMFYMYVGTGYSNDVGIFPKFRTGMSLYANLPKSFEGELGYRQLHFSDNIWMYTASVGKYYKNLWFNLRTYITPGESNISHSYTGTMRYYLGGAYDYFSVQAGTGISPEENRGNLLDNDVYKMQTFKVGLDYNFVIQRTNQFSISSTYFNQEYRPMQRGNQFDVNVGYRKLF